MTALFSKSCPTTSGYFAPNHLNRRLSNACYPNSAENISTPDRSRKIRVSTDIDSQRVEITIADEGEGFDPASVPDPTADENLEKPCGRGIMLMRAYMDEVIYNDKGNEVRMIRNRFSGLPKIQKTSANILERKDD